MSYGILIFGCRTNRLTALCSGSRRTRGASLRVDDRRVTSGIVRILKSGWRWVDAPEVCGPRKTLYNRFVRWAAKGIWTDIFTALVDTGGPPSDVMIDSSAVRAHRCASGGKRGAEPRHRAVARRSDHEDPCSDRLSWPPAAPPPHRRQCLGLSRRRPSSRCAAGRGHRPCGQGLRYRPGAADHRQPGSRPEPPTQGGSVLEDLLLALPLLRSQRHRAHGRSTEGLSPRRHEIRPFGRQLPCCRLDRRTRPLLVMSLEPNVPVLILRTIAGLSQASI
ncbi:putative transposase of IS4/5 family DUF4096 [Rhodothalassium salexigens DSM 2132]|uniref:Putative transposase of IS4/5 family DUF4096 n=1 Tax=Rhodothalassium salexigens DSM 2132 TaxID=1188247 RepID=A0A4R2PLL1_RHOSA|nr:putative transposase of IS4/5 family DUF4096 [Rhodothalassium salexigens DSM 2132]